MPAAPLPANEKERLHALESYNVLDTLPEKTYDDIVHLASIICETPIALVSLVDGDRQWFKSKVGVGVTETHRDLAFCAHAILNPEEMLIVEDATQDDRFSDNALVTGEPDIRFYAGCPLNTPSGHSLGTLCAIDRKPRSITENQKNALQVLTNNVVQLLELSFITAQRKNLIEDLKDSNASLEKFAYAASHDLKSPLTSISHLANWLEKGLGDKLDQENKKHLDQLQSRIRRMGRLLDDLLEYSCVEKETKNEERVSAYKMVEDVSELLAVPDEFRIKIAPSLKDILIPRMPLELILRNLISNAIKHAGSQTGEVRVSGGQKEGFYEFSVADNGPGIPEKFHDKIFEMFETLRSRDIVEGSGIGLSLVKKLVTQAGGNVSLQSAKGKGSTFTVTWPC